MGNHKISGIYFFFLKSNESLNIMLLLFSKRMGVTGILVLSLKMCGATGEDRVVGWGELLPGYGL